MAELPGSARVDVWRCAVKEFTFEPLNTIAKYKTPIPLEAQYELKGELLSALVKVQRLERGRELMVDLLQELMKDAEKLNHIRELAERWERNAIACDYAEALFKILEAR